MFDGIFFKGREAHEKGKQPHDNPYPIGTYQHESWQAGYNSYNELFTGQGDPRCLLVA